MWSEQGREAVVAGSERPKAERTRQVVVGPGELEVTVSGQERLYEVALNGELDMATAPELREELLRLSAEAGAHITVDLSGLAFVDSTGLSVLIIGLKRLRETGGDMALRSPSPGTLRVLEITGLTAVFAIS